MSEDQIYVCVQDGSFIVWVLALGHAWPMTDVASALIMADAIAARGPHGYAHGDEEFVALVGQEGIWWDREPIADDGPDAAILLAGIEPTMSEVPLSVVARFIRDLGLNPGQVTELHVTHGSVRVTRMIPLGPIEVDVKADTRVTFQTGEIQALLDELRVTREQIAKVAMVARHANEMTGTALDPAWVLEALSSAKWAAVAQEWNPDV